MQQQQFQVRQIQLAVYTAGPETAPPVFLIHGMAESGRYFWDPLVQELAESCRIIAIDLPGHGESSGDRWSYDPFSLIQVLMRVIRAYCSEPPVVIGHSLGGIISAELAIQYPDYVKGLVLYATPVPRGIWHNTDAMNNPSLWPLFPLFIPGIGLLYNGLPRAWLLKHLLRFWQVPFHPEVNPFSTNMLKQAGLCRGDTLAFYLRYLFAFNPLYQRLHQIQSSALVITGIHDVLVTEQQADAVARRIPDSQKIMVPNAGHVILFDQPVTFCRHIMAFLKSLNFDFSHKIENY